MQNRVSLTKYPASSSHHSPPFPLFAHVISCLLLCSCTTRPLHGGKSTVAPSPTGGLAQTLVQSDNPFQSSRQTQDFIRSRTYKLPSGSVTLSSTGGEGRREEADALTLSRSYSPTLLTEIQESHATTELGAAQKDTAREIGAKLSSLKSIVWVGLALFIFGLASLFWPPLQTIIGSVTTSAAITAGGLALIILPTLVVGNELLILGAVAVAVGGWFLAHRHGHVRGQLHTLSNNQQIPKHRSL